jgi:exopolysaccharide production protein ExoZ
MFFYVLFAFSMLFGRRRKAVLFGLILAISIFHFVPDGGVFQKFYTNNIIFEFGFGVLLQAVISRWYPRWPRYRFVTIVLAGCVLLAIGFYYEPRGLTAGLPASLIVWASFGACDRWLESRALTLLGNASYSIYLFHWASFGALKPFVPVDGSYLYPLMLLHVGFATIVGVLVHRIVERPIMGVAKSVLRLDRSVHLMPPSPVTSDCGRSRQD